jgi:hypothetical protein
MASLQIMENVKARKFHIFLKNYGQMTIIFFYSINLYTFRQKNRQKHQRHATNGKNCRKSEQIKKWSNLVQKVAVLGDYAEKKFVSESMQAPLLPSLRPMFPISFLR